MINLDIVRSRGLEQDDLKRAFENAAIYKSADKGRQTMVEGSKAQKLSNWVNRMSLRIQDGREECFRDHALYHAIDQAFEIPFRQVTPTLLQGLIDSDPDTEKVQDALKAYGFDMNKIIVEEDCSRTESKTGKRKRIDVPAFFQIGVPLVKAYTTIRLAKLMNDRKLVPLFKYEPAISNFRTRTKCEVITSRVEVMTRQLGYFNTINQAQLHALKYGRSLVFPVEAWFYEEQECQGEYESATFIQSKDKKGRKVRTVKEGIRHHVPPPTRTYFDDAYPISSFNSDSGCSFAGYWRVMRWSEVKNNDNYWNKDKISTGPNQWWSGSVANTFFNTVYNSCTLNWPVIEAGDGNDREESHLNRFYQHHPDDASVVLTNHFEKLIPSEVGLGDYNYPIWFRFVIAGYDTVVYCEPLPYCPIIAYLYDMDEARKKNASLSLEILPFQDHFSNLMTQFLLTVRQNLANVNFYDTDVEEMKGFIDKIKNFGEKVLRGWNWFPFSGKALLKKQTQLGQLVFSHRLQTIDTNGLLTAMKSVLDVLERVLVMSSQEVAQAASHELRAEEVRNISESSSSRLRYSAIPLDDAIDAHKRQVYQGLMSFGDDEFYAEIPMDRVMTTEELAALDITYDEDRHKPRVTDKKVTVKAKRSAMLIESFAANRDGSDRINNTEGGIAMLQSLAGLLNSPLYPNIGPDQFLFLINIAAQMMGYPREFKLENITPGVDPVQAQAQQQAQMQQMLGELQKGIMEKVQEVAQGLGQAQQGIAKELAGLEKVVEQIATKEVGLEQSVGKINEALSHIHDIANANDPGTGYEPGGGQPTESLVEPAGMS